jgi:Methyltransferase domain
VNPSPRTFSSRHLDRQRIRHARADGYGRHRHLYLHDTVRALASSLAATRPDGVTWLDYGCGKGGFIDEIRALGLFASITGYDPAISTFRARPSGTYDLVTCLDVIDTVEAKYLDAVLRDVAALTACLAVFDCLTRPKAESPLQPHAPFYWTHLVRQHMDVVETRVEFPGMQDFERAVIVAAPRKAT